MTNKRRTEITVETHQVTIIRTRSSLSVYCEICRTKVQLFSPPQIISLFRLKMVEIEQFFYNDQIHFVGSTEMICGNSIADYLKTNKTKDKKGSIQ